MEDSGNNRSFFLHDNPGFIGGAKQKWQLFVWFVGFDHTIGTTKAIDRFLFFGHSRSITEQELQHIFEAYDLSWPPTFIPE